QPPTEAGTETGWGGLMGRTTLTRQGAGARHDQRNDRPRREGQPVAFVRLQRHAAVRADLDAARMRIMRTLYRGAHSQLAECRCIRHAMTADSPSRPLGAA